MINKTFKKNFQLVVGIFCILIAIFFALGTLVRAFSKTYDSSRDGGWSILIGFAFAGAFWAFGSWCVSLGKKGEK
jgi:hypothetical protein